MLVEHWLEITAGWQAAFCQPRLFRRALCQALGTLVAFGRRTLSRALWAEGHQHLDWSADYRLHARAAWEPQALFQPVLERAMPWCGGRYVAVAVDDTRVHKTGRRIQSAFYQRDPLSPKFRFNLMYGLRFLQMSLLVPLHRLEKASARALPVRFEEVPSLKKPRRKAPPEEWQAWRRQTKLHNLSTHTLASLRRLRVSLDAAGATCRRLLAVGDNSFCNRTLLRPVLDRIEILVRSRRDVKLCRRAAGPGPRFYAQAKFTPEQVRQDDSIPWRKVRIFHAGQWRKVRYKELTEVYWQSGAGQRPLRLLVVAPIPYQAPGCRRKYYRDPAFLLCTDLQATARELLQPYFDRWQIEVNHREEKDTLGVGQAQLRSLHSVPRQPAFVVAAYSALLLAALLTFGPRRGSAFQPLPKWRRNASRPSCLDLITLLRKELAENPAPLQGLGFQLAWKTLGLAAAA
jgi:hypothetical protein